MKYKIITADGSLELMAGVMDAIEEGYEPIGGVCCQNYSWKNERKGYTEYDSLFAQAVIKRD